MYRIFALIGLLLLGSPAKAADSTVTAMTAASALSGTELTYLVQGGADRKGTSLQIAAYTYGLMSGDATASGVGAVTFATVNGNVGSFGSSTQCVALTVNAKGLITAAAASTCAPAVGSVTGLGTGIATALGVNVGSAGAPILFNGAGGTPSSMTMTNATGLPVSTGISGLGTGVATWLGTPSSANLFSALTTKTGSGGSAVFATGPTMTSPTIGTAATFSFISGSTQCLHVDTSGVLSGTGSDCGSGGGGSGTVTSVATSCGTTGGTITTSGTISAVLTPSSQTGTNYAFQGTDCGKLIDLSNASNQVPTIAQAGTGSFTTGWFAQVCNQGAGTQTITPATSTIGGASTYVLPAASAAAPACVGIVSDGTNYQVVPDITVNASYLSAGTVAAARGGAGTISGALKGNGSGVVSQAACADLSNGTTLCSTTPGTGVATAAAANLSAAGGLTSTIASGTSALGTSAIGSAACASVVTTSAPNTATTDVVLGSFNGDPTAVTGYIPLTAGMLTIIGYPTSGNVNWKVCNNTTSSITPGAITLNWRVVR